MKKETIIVWIIIAGLITFCVALFFHKDPNIDKHAVFYQEIPSDNLTTRSVIISSPIVKDGVVSYSISTISIEVTQNNP
jgi:hypothetical protein